MAASRLKTSGTCPACGGRLSLWTGMKAPTPIRVRCPHCRKTLRVRMRGLWLVLLLVVVLLVWLAHALSGVLRRFGWTGLVYLLPALALAWVVLDLAFGMLLYSFATFVPENPDA